MRARGAITMRRSAGVVVAAGLLCGGCSGEKASEIVAIAPVAAPVAITPTPTPTPAPTPEPTATTTTERFVILTNAHEAERILTDAYLEYVGRYPTRRENADFVSSLNRKEKRNPRVVTTTTEPTGDSTTTTSGGVSAEAAARTAAMNNPDYMSYQAARYMKMMLDNLGDPGGLGSGQATVR